MNKIVELPLTEPMYNTYQFEGSGGAVLSSNLSVNNWYLNEAVIISCSTKFLTGYTTPDIKTVKSGIYDNIHLDKIIYEMKYLNGHTNTVIHNLIDAGYYVYFEKVDDYYIKGKSWFNERHFYHDGLICGYNRNEKTYCIYAYDHNWVYKKFWITQKSFEKGRKSAFKDGLYGRICGVKPFDYQVDFSVENACNKICDYLNSVQCNYFHDSDERVFGLKVHDYIVKYLDKLLDNSIPYERMDWRVLRVIWNHKKVMYQRIKQIEKALSLDSNISNNYMSVVAEADTMRILYASYHMKRRDSLLGLIQNKLKEVKCKEELLLRELLNKVKCEV